MIRVIYFFSINLCLEIDINTIEREVVSLSCLFFLFFFFIIFFLLFPIFVITIYTIHNVVHSIRQSYNSRLKENLNQIIGLINM